MRDWTDSEWTDLGGRGDKSNHGVMRIRGDGNLLDLPWLLAMPWILMVSLGTECTLEPIYLCGQLKRLPWVYWLPALLFALEIEPVLLTQAQPA